MNEPFEHEVYFFEACSKCKYMNKSGWDEPCNECLENPTNYETHKPLKFEPADKK